MTAALHVLFFLATPLLALWLEGRHRVFRWVNPVVFCYLAGMALANLPGAVVDAPTAATVSEAAIPLAIPLILFSSDLRAWRGRGRATLVSFTAAALSVLVTAGLAARFLTAPGDEAWKLSGMLVGVYTGGTPNLVSIGMALDAREETFVLLNAADVVLGGAYLLVLLTIAKPILRRILPVRAPDGPTGAAEAAPSAPRLGAVAPGMAVALGLSALIVAASAGLTIGLAGELSVPGVFLGITTGGIAASFVPRVRRLPGSYALGNYCILVFCVAMGARTDLGELMSSGGAVLTYTAAVMIGAILLHVLAAVILRIDVDTLLVTSTAAVYGPPFVPVVAETIGNRGLVLPGLTAGLLGYAVGNYLGIGLAWVVGP